jgi:hypothetical protein
MPDTIHVPLLGNVNKGVAIAGGGSLIAVGGYLLWKHMKAKTAAATVPSASTTSGYGGYGSYAYGYGTGYGYGAYTSAPEDYYGYGDMGGSAYPNYGYGTGTTAITSNSQWITAAENALATEGYLPATVQAALGVYLAGGTLTSQQSAIVQAAIAAVGNPPTPPATTTTAPSSGQSGTGSSSTTTTGSGASTPTVVVPNVVGQRLDVATGNLTAAGLKEGGASQISGVSQTVISQTPSAGTQVAQGSMVTLRTKSS